LIETVFADDETKKQAARVLLFYLSISNAPDNITSAFNTLCGIG